MMPMPMRVMRMMQLLQGAGGSGGGGAWQRRHERGEEVAPLLRASPPPLFCFAAHLLHASCPFCIDVSGFNATIYVEEELF
jgi:hypothetical protein